MKWWNGNPSPFLGLGGSNFWCIHIFVSPSNTRVKCKMNGKCKMKCTQSCVHLHLTRRRLGLKNDCIRISAFLVVLAFPLPINFLEYLQGQARQKLPHCLYASSLSLFLFCHPVSDYYIYNTIIINFCCVTLFGLMRVI